MEKDELERAHLSEPSKFRKQVILPPCSPVLSADVVPIIYRSIVHNQQPGQPKRERPQSLEGEEDGDDPASPCGHSGRPSSCLAPAHAAQPAAGSVAPLTCIRVVDSKDQGPAASSQSGAGVGAGPASKRVSDAAVAASTERIGTSRRHGERLVRVEESGFDPPRLRVPVGSAVTFVLSSPWNGAEFALEVGHAVLFMDAHQQLDLMDNAKLSPPWFGRDPVPTCAPDCPGLVPLPLLSPRARAMFPSYASRRLCSRYAVAEPSSTAQGPSWEGKHASRACGCVVVRTDDAAHGAPRGVCAGGGGACGDVGLGQSQYGRRGDGRGL
jgi:hypothetical protein